MQGGIKPQQSTQDNAPQTQQTTTTTAAAAVSSSSTTIFSTPEPKKSSSLFASLPSVFDDDQPITITPKSSAPPPAPNTTLLQTTTTTTTTTIDDAPPTTTIETNSDDDWDNPNDWDFDEQLAAATTTDDQKVLTDDNDDDDIMQTTTLQVIDTPPNTMMMMAQQADLLIIGNEPEIEQQQQQQQQQQLSIETTKVEESVIPQLVQQEQDPVHEEPVTTQLVEQEQDPVHEEPVTTQLVEKEQDPVHEAPNDWKQDDLDDMYDDDDDDDDDSDDDDSDDDEQDQLVQQESKPVTEEQTSAEMPAVDIDYSFNPPTNDDDTPSSSDPAMDNTPAPDDALLDAQQDGHVLAAVAEIEAAVMAQQQLIPQGVPLDFLSVPDSPDLRILDGVPEKTSPDYLSMAPTTDTPLPTPEVVEQQRPSLEPPTSMEPTNSDLEDEIAGMLDERSQPEEELLPVGIVDEPTEAAEIVVDEPAETVIDDDPFGFSQPSEDELPATEEAIRSDDLLKVPQEAPPTAAAEIPSMVETQVDAEEELPAEIVDEPTEAVIDDDPFGFSQPSEDELPATDETIRSDDLLKVSQEAPPTAAAEIQSMVETQVDEPGQQAEPPLPTEEPAMVPASVLDQFTNQMHRLEEHHHVEIQDLQSQHNQHMTDLRNSITHDECEAQRNELEHTFLDRLRVKDEQLQEILRLNEGMKLKMDVLKREVTGTRQLLEERESAIGSTSAAHNQAKQLMEQKLKNMEQFERTAQGDVYQLQAQLLNAQDELAQSSEAYALLKARVKAVATELKERRGECRTLAITNMELTDANEHLTTKMATLQAQVEDGDRSEVEKGEERNQLHDKIKTLQEELQEAEKKIQERGAVGEKALAAYKKKAQNSLAVGNARTASAMQAKEEAELEARAARSTADEAVDRARKAEAKGNEALAEARAYVKDMEAQKAEVESKANEAIGSFSETQSQLKEAKTDAEAARTAREKMAKEVTTLNHDLQLEKNQTSELQQDCSDLQQRSNDLYDEVETLREELRKSATAAFMANEGSGSETNGVMDVSTLIMASNVPDKSASEATILMLQRELQDANQAIKELKETLRSTLETLEQNGTAAGSTRRGPTENATTNQGGANDSTPLFYAMEKQAELNQAREEINRLATLLGALQSEKMQAYDAVEDMKRGKEAAEARLARYEKMGPSGGSKRNSSTRTSKAASYGGYGSSSSGRGVDTDARSIGSVDSMDSMDGPTDESSQINLEYLKNVMLSYLNAKTLNQRKRLVPAVSAVLCLTPEEAAAAMKSVEDSGSVESVGLSFFEGLKLV